MNFNNISKEAPNQSITEILLRFCEKSWLYLRRYAITQELELKWKKIAMYNNNNNNKNNCYNTNNCRIRQNRRGIKLDTTGWPRWSTGEINKKFKFDHANKW